jgi:hypothetical protein
MAMVDEAFAEQGTSHLTFLCCGPSVSLVMYARPTGYMVFCVPIFQKVRNRRVAWSRKEADKTTSEECCAALGGKHRVHDPLELEGEK